ncbi:MAG: glycyl-tRNA synthetase beta chain [Sphingomonadales bacterium]|nr:glycyl-tRNA synthetase beta chain [Sphingomonadales bacterium]
MPDFLLELLSEEIPARMQAKASADLARLFEAELGKAGIRAEAVETYATPRRLALIARNLPAATEPVREEVKGPRAAAPPQALEGFLRKTGLTREQLEERDGILFAITDRPGRPASDVLAEAVPAIIRNFPWPKSMRWGEASVSTESLRWVRPLQGIVALLGEDIVPFEIAGVTSGAATIGHRFHHPGIITIGSANDYVEKLLACHVIVDPAERRRIIADGARAAAGAAGLTLVEDEGLLVENAGLTEWPVPLLGRFDPAFLDVPREVIQLTMRTNQKYFACTAADGSLAPNFVCTANIDAADGGTAIVAGNERVLSARLADAKFFWEQDLKIPLEKQAEKLGQIVFHEKLGTVADKVERVAKLARWLVEEGIVKPSPRAGEGRLAEGERGEGKALAGRALTLPLGSAERAPPSPAGGEGLDLADLAERAARLAKADLVTGLVGEFPELQGVIGGHLACAQSEPAEVADAIRDHYKPVGQGDEVPTAPVTVAVSLADKLDTIIAFFAVGERPTGSKDPFALRRAALGVLAMETGSALRFGIGQICDAWTAFFDPERNGAQDTLEQLRNFFADRLKVQQREAGVRHDLIDAIFAVGGEDDLIRLLARVRALQAFVETPEGSDLLAGYKRAANILKKEGWAGPNTDRHPGLDPGSTSSSDDEGKERWMPDQVRHDGSMEGKPLSYTPLPEEASLIAALDAAEPQARAAVAAEDFEGAMAALASLRAPVDAFFDKVTVNDSDPVKREARLNLLARMRDAVHRVADFSKIEG